MLLMSLIALPLMWDAARRIAGKNYALAAMFLLALNPWHIVLSRWALEANMLPHVLLLAVDLLLAGMQKRWALYLSMVLFGLAPYAYASRQFRCRSSCCLRRFFSRRAERRSRLIWSSALRFSR